LAVMKEIVLASASPRRSELLKRVGIAFSVMPSNIEEKIDVSWEPEVLAEELSYSKALYIAEQLKRDCLVIGADTIVVKDGVLGKPRDEAEAYEMLKRLQGSWHEVITGVTIINAGDMVSLKDHVKTRVKMRSMTDDVIYSYIRTKEPMDKAGAYGVQGMGALLVEAIEGCYFNVVGLPLMKLGTMLENFGVRLL